MMFQGGAEMQQAHLDKLLHKAEFRRNYAAA